MQRRQRKKDILYTCLIDYRTCWVIVGDLHTFPSSAVSQSVMKNHSTLSVRDHLLEISGSGLHGTLGSDEGSLLLVTLHSGI